MPVHSDLGAALVSPKPVRGGPKVLPHLPVVHRSAVTATAPMPLRSGFAPDSVRSGLKD